MSLENFTKIQKVMAVAIGVALCLQRLSMAIGSICWGIAIASFLYLLYISYNMGTLKTRIEEYKPYYKVILLMWLCFLPTIIFTPDFKISIKTFTEMWIYRLMPFFMVTLFLQNKKYLTRIAAAFIIATSLDSIVALAQLILGMGSRGWGFGGNILNLASLLCIIMPILLIIIVDDSFSDKAKNLAKVAIFCCTMGLIAGKSRGAWVALAVVLPMVSFTYIIRSKKYIIIALAVVLVLVGSIASSQVYRQRVMSITNITTDSSNADRIKVWNSALRMIKDNPVTGVGLGNFKKEHDSKYRLEGRNYNLVHCHNNILQIWSEAGTIGVFGFLYMSLYIFTVNFREWLKSKDPYSLMIWGSWLGFMIFGMFDLIIDHAAITKVWWFALATLLYFSKCKKVGLKNDIV